MSMAAATEYRNCAMRHPVFCAQKRRKAQKSSDFWASGTYRLCIKDRNLIEKTLSTLIQTNDTYESTQIDAFFESKPKIDAFLKIDANAQKVGIQNGILTPDVLETGCRFYVCGIFLVCFLYCVLRTSEKRAVSSFPLSCMPRLIHSSIHP